MKDNFDFEKENMVLYCTPFMNTTVEEFNFPPCLSNEIQHSKMIIVKEITHNCLYKTMVMILR